MRFVIGVWSWKHFVAECELSLTLVRNAFKPNNREAQIVLTFILVSTSVRGVN